MQGRLYILAAAVLWSLSGFFSKVIQVPGPVMAFYRVLFAALVLVPLLRGSRLTFQPAMFGMAASFALMNATFITALTVTTAANAIFLQYTAPLWMLVVGALYLGEKIRSRNVVCLCIGLVGVAVLIAGNWSSDDLGVILGLMAGLSFGLLAVFLRRLRGENSVWLTVVNHLAGALLLLPFLWFGGYELSLSWGATVGLACFGAVQMALPYVLFTIGLRSVEPQEAGLLALLEPLLLPVWAYLAVGEVPHWSSLLGGSILLTALSLRYIPFPGRNKS